MRKTVLLITLILFQFASKAQHRKLPVEDFEHKSKKELFNLYEQYNLKIAASPEAANPYFQRGWLKYHLGDTTNALTDVKKAVMLDPKNPFYHYAYAYIIIDKGEYETVINECNEALKYDKTFVDVFVMKGSALDLLKRPAEARELYSRALQIDSTYEDIYLQFVSSYALTNNMVEAEGMVIRLLNQYPNSGDGLKCKSRILMYQKKYNEAISLADELIKSKRSLTENYLLKTAAYDSLRNQPKACECMYKLSLMGYIDGYEYIMAHCPKEQEDRYIKGQTLQMKAIELEKQLRYEESMELFNQAIKLEPDSGLGYYNRGKLKRKMEDHKAAIEDYLIAIKKSPHHSASYVAAGVSYTFLGDLENAKKYYLKSMQVDPLNEMAYYNFADILTKNDGNYKEAIYYYKYAIDIKPDYTKAHYWLGNAYAKLGMNAEACESFKIAEQLGEVKAISQRLWYCK
jgi:tetratricopeptide (TPR) repeat protein